MTRDVATVGEHASFKHVARVLAMRQISAVPVLDADGSLVGIISEADLLHKQAAKHPARTRGLSNRRQRQACAKAAGDRAAELMSVPVMTVGPDATLDEAAKMIDGYEVKQLPVVNDDGQLIGMVGPADLLTTFLRPDRQILDEIRGDVLLRGLWIDPDSLEVTVHNGVVRLGSRVDTKSLIPIVERLTRSVQGVTGVINLLTFDYDDAWISFPSDVWVDRPVTVRRRQRWYRRPPLPHGRTRHRSRNRDPEHVT